MRLTSSSFVSSLREVFAQQWGNEIFIYVIIPSQLIPLISLIG